MLFSQINNTKELFFLLVLLSRLVIMFCSVERVSVRIPQL